MRSKASPLTLGYTSPQESENSCDVASLHPKPKHPALPLPTYADDGAVGEAGVLRQLRTEGGFWLPNNLVDNLLLKIKPLGLAVYCVLCRSLTRKDYPSPGAIAEKLGLTQQNVWKQITVLYENGLLNDSDIDAISFNGKTDIDDEQ